MKQSPSAQLLKLSAFCRTRRSITVFTTHTLFPSDPF